MQICISSLRPIRLLPVGLGYDNVAEQRQEMSRDISCFH